MSDSDFNVRDAIADDHKTIVEIYNSTIPGRMVTADTDPVTVESKARWFEEHNSGNRPLWVVEDKSGKVIGWVSFQSFYGRPAYNGTVEISIYLHELARGKGLGKKILKYSIDRAAKMGMKTLLGFIFAHNEPSLKLFRSEGFEDWAYLPDIAVLDGIERGLRILGKKIA